MDSDDHPAQQNVLNERKQLIEEGWQGAKGNQESIQRNKSPAKVKQETQEEPNMLYFGPKNEADRAIFVNGLSVGLGIGCIVTFVVMWIVLFFTPQLPAGATYENLLSMFIFPLIYLLALGLITLTAGIVREYYTAKFKP